MRRCSDFFVAVLALRTDSFRQIDEGMRVDVLSLVQNAVHGERHIVETVVHGIGVRVHGAVPLGVQAFHAEAAAAWGRARARSTAASMRWTAASSAGRLPHSTPR